MLTVFSKQKYVYGKRDSQSEEKQKSDWAGRQKDGSTKVSQSFTASFISFFLIEINFAKLVKRKI